MSITGFVQTPKRIYRLSQILQILAKHGFGHLIYNLKLHTYLPLSKRIQDKTPKKTETGDGSFARRLALVCEELGPTFVKLGQVLSTRPDIIPESIVKELTALQNKVSPFASELSRSIIENELKAHLSEIFPYFEDIPMASGSIGQVHNARLSNGTEVVVKVKRPGINSIITNDISILSYIAEQAEKIEDFKIYRPTMIVNEFARRMEHELDFISEASNTARFYKIFEDDNTIKIPRVFWDYTTHSVLTLERFAYTNLTDIHKLKEMGIDKKKLATDLMSLFVAQYFQKNLFHADPHPGNLMVSNSGAIAMIDFGMIGYVSEELKNQIGASLIALIKRDLDLFVDIFMDMGVVSTDINLHGLQLSLFEIMEKYYGMPLKNVDAKKAFSDIMSLAREYDMMLPQDFILLAKSFVTVTSIARTLDPDFNFIETVTPFAHRLLKDKFSPSTLTKKATITTWHLTNLIRHAPKEIRYILRKIMSGNMQIVLKHKGLETLITDIDRSSNRLALSIILASTVIASSIIMMAGIGPTILGNISVLGIIGYLLATFMGFSLVIAIFRSGRL